MAARRRRVLGNDPFKRGSAERTPLTDAPLPERRTLPPTPELQMARKKKANAPPAHSRASDDAALAPPAIERKTHVSHANAPDAVRLDVARRDGASPATARKTHGSEPVPHAHASDAVRLDGALRDGASPVVQKKVHGREPVAHAHAPDAVMLDGSLRDGASPGVHGREPVPHAHAPDALRLDGALRDGASPVVQKKVHVREPVPHAHAPDAVMLDGPMAHGSSPGVQKNANEPVAHTHAPDAVALDGPLAHGSSPAVRFDPVAHDLTPDGIELEVGSPQAHSHSPAANADPVPHAETPELVERLHPSRSDSSSELPAPSEPLAVGGTLRGLMRAVRTAVGLASRSTQVDPWGKDTSLAASLRPLANLLYDSYWRVSVDGAGHMPRGPCIVVANHAGALPLDGPMLHLVLRRERPELLESRWLLEDQIFHAPFIGVLANRLGAVRASPENALRLLDEGRPVLVFPEGFQALSKPMRERYQLRKFGRGGYVKIAARGGVPIVPVAIVGGEEAMPLLAKLPARALGLPYLPLTLPPLPVQWKIRFAPPIHLDDAPADVESDPSWVEQTNLRVRDTIDSMLVELLRDAGKPRVG